MKPDVRVTVGAYRVRKPIPQWMHQYDEQFDGITVTGFPATIPEFWLVAEFEGAPGAEVVVDFKAEFFGITRINDPEMYRLDSEGKSSKSKFFGASGIDAAGTICFRFINKGMEVGRLELPVSLK